MKLNITSSKIGCGEKDNKVPEEVIRALFNLISPSPTSIRPAHLPIIDFAEPLAPAASIADPLLRWLGRTAWGQKFLQSSIGRWLGPVLYVAYTALGASFLETKGFHQLFFGKAVSISMSLGLGSVPSVLLSMAVVALVFAAAHTAVVWIVRALERGKWNKEVLRQDAKDFAIRSLLSVVFTLPFAFNCPYAFWIAAGMHVLRNARVSMATHSLSFAVLKGVGLAIALHAIWNTLTMGLLSKILHLTANFLQRIAGRTALIPGGTIIESAVNSVSEERYIRDREAKEMYLHTQQVADRFIAPGLEDFDKFKDLYGEVKDVLRQLLTAQGLNPDGYNLYLVDSMDPNAAVMRHYNVVFVNLGLLRMLVERGASRDTLAFVLSHEVTHIQQLRDDVDRGVVDESEGFIDRRLGVRDRALEYEADLKALELMDKSGFSVKEAPVFFETLLDWMQARKLRDGKWGDHPQLEERLRKMNRLITDYHWNTYLTNPTPLKPGSISQARERTRYRTFQESVMHANTVQELQDLLEHATSPEELQFALLVGHEMFPVSNIPLSGLKQVFQRRLDEFIGNSRAKQVLYNFMRDMVYTMIQRGNDDGIIERFNTIAKNLDSATLLEILELGIPNLFMVNIDVDPLPSGPAQPESQRCFGLFKRDEILNGPQAKHAHRPFQCLCQRPP